MSRLWCRLGVVSERVTHLLPALSAALVCVVKFNNARALLIVMSDLLDNVRQTVRYVIRNLPIC